jgi:hypothetical protein
MDEKFRKGVFAKTLLALLYFCACSGVMHSTVIANGAKQRSATTTFDKRIIIDDKAADVLIGLLGKPAPTSAANSGISRRRIGNVVCAITRRNYRNKKRAGDN